MEILGCSKLKEATKTGKKYYTVLCKLEDYDNDFGIRPVEMRLFHDVDLSKFVGKKVKATIHENHYDGKTSIRLLEVVA
jgi:hypothetical protein